jgi:hypothetical protein
MFSNIGKRLIIARILSSLRSAEDTLKAACFHPLNQQIARAMGLPMQSVTLTAEQIHDLNKKVSTLRHDINNNLTLIIAALELIRYKPEMAEKMIATMNEQPMKISAAMAKFSEDFEKTLGIPRK